MSNFLKMKKKSFLVVGGSKGIGLATVNLLVADGHNVTVISRNRDELPVHPLIHHIIKDITADEISNDDLPGVIDGLVYCPGSIVLKPLKSLSEEQFLSDFAINCLGAVKIIKSALTGLRKSENTPGIVLFSTVAVTQGLPFHTSIAASKGAVEGLTKSLAAEFAPSIRVNCIAPSITRTDLASKLLSSPEKIQAAEQRHPLKTIGIPENLAEITNFLLSDGAKWMTGQIIHPDGGLSSIRV